MKSVYLTGEIENYRPTEKWFKSTAKRAIVFNQPFNQR
jgi:hypothetical protein